MTDRIGQQLGHYRLLRLLGQGAFAEVYLAEHLYLERLAAIKVLHAQIKPRTQEQFRREARTIAHLQHPHIVPVLDFGLHDKTPYLVMEYTPGGTLRSQHPQGTRLLFEQIVTYVKQIASALDYAHQQGVIHRDVKPDNLLLTATHKVLLSDFGLAVVQRRLDSLSMSHSAVGAPLYMAPEQFQKHPCAASDQYALGILVYEWLTGKTPFRGRLFEVFRQHLSQPPPSLRAALPDLPVAVEEAVFKALAKVPKQRFACVEDFASALEQAGLAIQSLPLHGRPEQRTPEQTRGTEYVLAPPAAGPQVDWGDALDVPSFYGRQGELATLGQWMVQEHCRVVSVLGMGGIGKSALVTSAMRQVVEHFQVVLFRSLRDAPSCEALLEECLQRLAPQPLDVGTADLERRLGLLLEHLREQRVLLVLDNLESVLQAGEARGHLRPGYEGYSWLLQGVAERAHQSCLLLTSREKPAVLRALEGRKMPVRSLRLGGLEAAACEQLLASHELLGSPEERARLVERYEGNPLALNIVAQTIADLFGGQITPFLAQDTLVFGSISDLLDEQWGRLSPLEQTLLFWFAILREPVSLQELQAVLVAKLSAVQVLEAVDGLRRRSLIERGQRPGSFTLQSVVLEYVTDRLVSTASQEIVQGRLRLLREHGLSQAQAKEYVRQTQERLLVAPLLARLQSTESGHIEVEQRLRSLLEEVRSWAEDRQGYGPANLVTLLRVRRGHLRGLDLSRLVLRGVYLQGVEMQDADLSGALLQESVFTETFDAILAVAVSPDGGYWAAVGKQGEVRVWEARGQTLHRVWQAHTGMVWSLAFSPDGRALATGSHDGSIKLWDLESGALLWTGWHTNNINRVAFAPDGSLLASSGTDAAVRLWDPQRGTHLETLPHPDPVCATAWSPDRRLLATGDIEGCIRLWEMHKGQPATCIAAIAGHTDWVIGLAFAPDGSILASASWDLAIKLWEVASGNLRQTCTGHTDRIQSLAWSPDGRTLASSSRDTTIWLWDAQRASARVALQGHAAEVYSVAFTPDSARLLSGSDDGSLRLWDLASGQCVRVIQGYTASLFDIDWSPDGRQLVSGGTDMLVTIWDVAGGTQPRVLHGHRGVVSGVGWSPDSRTLASSAWDDVITLWNPTSGACVELQQNPDDPNTFFSGAEWSPDGQRLAIGTYLHGVLIWELTAHRRRWIGHESQAWIRHVSWSPDGTRLVGGGDDGHVYVWDASDGTLLQRMQGHQGVVTSVAWNSDGTRLASGSSGRDSGELFVWEAQSGARLQAFEGHLGMVSAVTWGRREDLLVSGGGDGVLRWWMAHSGECVRVQQTHQGTVQALKVSPDGQMLASCGNDGAIKIWDVESGEHLRTLRRDRPYERLTITGIRGLTQAQIATLRALGAVEDGVL
jgi:WD40 repeat protein/tRNA A-37 threonylcarbamoyl transferase component Bud32